MSPETGSSPTGRATVVVDRELPAVQAFFGFESWPEEVVRYDLGGRVLELIGTPGHQAATLTIYDPWSGFLLTADNVLPGRIYAFDFPAYLDSMERTVEFATQPRGLARHGLPHRDDPRARAATIPSAAPISPTSRRCR